MKPMIWVMKTTFVKPTKWQLAVIFLASITTATSGIIMVSAYANLNSPTVDRTPVVYQFFYPEPFERENGFDAKLFS